MTGLGNIDDVYKHYLKLAEENQQLKELLKECREFLYEILTGTHSKLSFKLESGIRKKDYMISLSELKTKIDNEIGERTMGTNYYLHTDFCPCCGKPREEAHLGKTSYGWKFLFHKTKQVYDYKSFCNFIKQGIIYDEYGDKYSSLDMLDLVDSFQNDKEHPNCEHIDGYDFLASDFC